jgi:hypothetical protein
VRLARATGGGVNFWMELPIFELLNYMLELADQITQENEVLEQAAKRRR